MHSSRAPGIRLLISSATGKGVKESSDPATIIAGTATEARNGRWSLRSALAGLIIIDG